MHTLVRVCARIGIKIHGIAFTVYLYIIGVYFENRDSIYSSARPVLTDCQIISLLAFLHEYLYITICCSKISDTRKAYIIAVGAAFYVELTYLVDLSAIDFQFDKLISAFISGSNIKICLSIFSMSKHIICMTKYISKIVMRFTILVDIFELIILVISDAVSCDSCLATIGSNFSAIDIRSSHSHSLH